MSNKQPLTFHQFRKHQASWQWHHLDGSISRLYHVVGVRGCEPDRVGYIVKLEYNRWCLSICGNSLISNDLLDLEFKLWQWYVKEQILEIKT